MSSGVAVIARTIGEPRVAIEDTPGQNPEQRYTPHRWYQYSVARQTHLQTASPVPNLVYVHRLANY